MQTRFSLLDWWFYYHFNLRISSHFWDFCSAALYHLRLKACPQFFWKNQGLLKYLFEFSPNWSSCKRKKKKQHLETKILKNPSIHPKALMKSRCLNPNHLLPVERFGIRHLFHNLGGWPSWFHSSTSWPRSMTRKKVLQPGRKGEGWRLERSRSQTVTLCDMSLGKKARRKGLRETNSDFAVKKGCAKIRNFKGMAQKLNLIQKLWIDTIKDRINIPLFQSWNDFASRYPRLPKNQSRGDDNCSSSSRSSNSGN